MKVSFKQTLLTASLWLAFLPVHAASMSTAEAARFLNHATYGATLKEISLVQRIGMDAWIYQQLRKKQCTHYDAAAYQATPELAARIKLRDNIWWTRSVTCDDQLRQRVALALSEIFVVSDQDGTLRRHQDALADYYDTLAKYSLGNFRGLLKAVSLHPVMGSYLNMRGNEAANGTTNVRPDENYARELMQLFTIGLVQLNVDGTPVAGNIPTYKQTDVSEFARMLTGWTWKGIDTNEKWKALKKKVRPDVGQDYISPMVYLSTYHDIGKKSFLGRNIPAGLTADVELDKALDILFAHPNVGPFISKQLIQRLVKSNPSPEYVGRVARVFNNNGGGIRGDMASVVRAVLTDGEALTEQDKQGKTRKLVEPLLRITQLWRAFATNAAGAAGTNNFFYAATDGTLGQSPLSAPTVFNFYEPTYAPNALKSAGLAAPEFQLVDESLLPRLTNRLASMTTFGYIGSGSIPEGFASLMNYDEYAALLGKPNDLLDRLNVLLMSGKMTAEMRVVLLEMITELQKRKTITPKQIVAEVVHMIIISPQYSIQW